MNKWKSEAAKVLNTTYGAYSKSIAVVVEPGRVVGSLPGPNADEKHAWLARMQEFGFGPGGIGTQGEYDMRVAGQRLLYGPKAKQGKHGPYLVIPFKFNTKEASAAAGTNAPNLFKKLSGGNPGFSTPSAWGTRLPANQGKKLKPHHVSTQAAGMIRQGAVEGSSGKTATTGYYTFRTASMANTDPSAWRTKGVEAKNIAASVVKSIPKLIQAAGLA